MPVDRTLSNIDSLLDLVDGIGIRTATYRFELIDGITHGKIADITPLLGATLSHDTTITTKRQLNLSLGAADTAIIDVVNNRVDPYMIIGGNEYPLGRYMFTDGSRQKFTSGKQGAFALTDEMYAVDQQITSSINSAGNNVNDIIQDTLTDDDVLSVDLMMETTPFTSTQSWGIGTNRGSILEALAVSGDLFSPWFGNDKKLHFIRSFEPASAVIDFDFDVGNKVLASSIVETDDLLTAPNRIIVISNSSEDPDNPVFGVADVPTSAPHSIINRGFVVPNTIDLQVVNNDQAAAMAQNLAIRQTIFERVTINTAPDPRHDSYNVIKWDNEQWLEIGWSMTLVEGAPMAHTMRKSYS